MVCCVIGPQKCGKTLLLKRLQEKNFEPYKDFFSLPITVQTNGTNLLRLIKKNDQNEDQEYLVQEIGGEIIELCLDFLTKCNRIIYVIDSSETNQLSLSFKYLMKILTSDLIYKKPVLIVLNKTDQHSNIRIAEFKELLFLENLKNEFTGNSLKILQSSCLTGKGVKEIYEWITKNII